MKFRPELIFTLLLFSWICHPTKRGKIIFIHNQTNKPLIILDSLTGNYLRLYDTAMVNDRRYISRKANYLTEYNNYQKFYTNLEMDNLRNKKINTITLYFIDPGALQNILKQISTDTSLRSFDVNIDTLKKYQLNHLFITNDTVLFEHDHNYFTNWKR